MIYFETRDSLRHMERILATAEQIVAIEHQVRETLRKRGTQYLGPHDMFRYIREEAGRSYPEYAQLRESYARMIPRANSICQKENIAWHRQGRAAPLEGGLPFQGSIFELILNRPSDLMDIDTDLRDTTNQVIGALQERASQEQRQLINPLYWIGKATVFVVRLPYNVLKLSGFDVDKIQEHFIARLAQLLYVIALILIVVRLGLGSAIDLGSLLRGLILK